MNNDVLLKLKKEFDEKINSHVFLIETDDVEKCVKDIKDLIKYIIKADNIAAHQIDEENYLELIIIRPNGKEIKKDQIKELQDRIKLSPILSDYLSYVIVNSEKMNDISSNKMLKTIEEPNAHILGFLITDNIDIILPTIKSRCEILSIYYKSIIQEEIPKEILEISKEMIKAIEKKDHHTFYKLKSNEKILKENYKIVENIIKDYYNTACKLSIRNKYEISDALVQELQNKNSYSELIAKTKYINKLQNKLTRNMNGDLLLEKMFLELKEVK